MRRIAIPFVLALILSLAAACSGGDGGPSAAFCDGLDTLSDQITDGDDIDDQIDTIENDLAEAAADGEQTDAVQNVADEYSDEDNDQTDLAEAVQDELGDFAEECEIDSDEFAVAPTTTTTEVPETTTTTILEETTTAPVDGGGDASVLARADVPAGIAPEFAALAGACFNSDMEACDTLFDTTPVGGVDEAYGATCGGRLADADVQPSQCSSIITAPLAVPAEVVDQATAAACFNGDMVACDDLFNNAAAGSLDETYGGLCAGRVANTQAFCVDIFGDVAFI